MVWNSGFEARGILSPPGIGIILMKGINMLTKHPDFAIFGEL
ncbi:MAG: hypothetical protein U9N32_07400 [Spirochaetota bacterium]|nr:hypothetical protein [Spirochaetota bacterium]